MIDKPIISSVSSDKQITINKFWGTCGLFSLGLSLCIQLYYSLGHFLDEFQWSRFTSGVLDPKVGVGCNVPPFLMIMCIGSIRR